jgi:hypothetical protein
MNDDLAAGPADSDAPVTGAAEALPPTSFGARLNWERERLGLTVTDVAARLRLHPNQVRAIEQESLAKLPEAAYVRGFVRSYARVLNLDPRIRSSMAWCRPVTIRRCAPPRTSMPRARSSWQVPSCC